MYTVCFSSSGHASCFAFQNLVGVKTHLHTAFGVLFATSELRDSRVVSRPYTLLSACPYGYLARLRGQPLSQIEENLKNALTLLHAYAENDRDFLDVVSCQDHAAVHGMSNCLPPVGTNQAIHALFQAIEDDQICTFPMQVTQIAENLRRLFGDVVRLQNKLSSPDKRTRISQTALEDSFSIIDLLHSIANRHRSCPELRLFWLMQITEKHYELSQFAEAAQCLCHCAAIVAEHLVNRGLIPAGVAAVGCADIAEAVGNWNLLEESCICGPNGPGVNGICCPSPLLLPDLCPSVSGLDTAWYFSPAGWAALIAWTASAFAKADSHELVPRIYSRLIPVLETSNEYTRLAEVHGRIKEAYTALEKLQPLGIDYGELIHLAHRLYIYRAFSLM
ncbi:unnamed protein product [Echinostoma caproni]|uniref:DOCKER domain-containing protein n=1 Tax=Echinostoma caproni TaxID=27848 RepID=A0A183B3H9_9TREM|nr:unnamed protein product [Echinostoma caproni]